LSAPPISATSQAFITVADFDTALDDSIGYLNSSAPGFWDQILPSIPISQISGFGRPPSYERRRLGRRDWNLVSVASALTEVLWPYSIFLHQELIVCTAELIHIS
jgi:hypothetical protein